MYSCRNAGHLKDSELIAAGLEHFEIKFTVYRE